MATYLVTSVTSKTHHTHCTRINMNSEHMWPKVANAVFFGIGQVFLTFTLLRIRKMFKNNLQNWKKKPIRFRIMSSYEHPKTKHCAPRWCNSSANKQHNKITTVDFRHPYIYLYATHTPFLRIHEIYLIHQRHRWHDAQHFVIYRPTKQKTPTNLSLRQKFYLICCHRLINRITITKLINIFASSTFRAVDYLCPSIENATNIRLKFI